MQKEQTTTTGSSLIGGILLVAGCCIGAGMLGLPVLSAMAGFQPSLVMFVLSWAYMACTGLLLLEVTLWFQDDVNIVSMAGRCFGLFGKAVAWVMFLFLFYCLMVAYIAGSGELFVDFISAMTGATLPAWIGSVLFVLGLGALLYMGTHAIDHCNRILMVGLIVSYFVLIGLGSLYVNPSLLSYQNWSLAPLALPAMIVSFGFHNLVPSLTTYFRRDVARLRAAILIGSALPLCIYLVWEWLILGLVPVEGQGGFQEALQRGQLATHVLRSVSGNPWVFDMAQVFAFFAIVTSFVAVALSFLDFLADGLQVKKVGMRKIGLCCLVLLPPLLFSLAYPQVFLMALNYAGGIGAVILFGILPAAMVWRVRYYNHSKVAPLVPGGKVTLAIIITISVAIVILQMTQ
ncbi:MAG: tyrosine transporter [Parachlamydiaceae bacterium]|nr:tyrosine transporter [Parachlamydiaceae bacterium]